MYETVGFGRKRVTFMADEPGYQDFLAVRGPLLTSPLYAPRKVSSSESTRVAVLPLENETGRPDLKAPGNARQTSTDRRA